MKSFLAALAILGATTLAAAPPLPDADLANVADAFRIAQTYGPKVWPGFDAKDAPLILIRGEFEYLLNSPDGPMGFAPTPQRFREQTVFARARNFPPNLEASFPAIGRDAVIVGTPEATKRTPDEWSLIVCHELFHVFQRRHGMVEKIATLDLAPKQNDNGMWMLNYPFPYADAGVTRAMRLASDELALALHDDAHASLARDAMRNLTAMLKPNDAKYLHFVLTNEGVARYFEYEVAKLAGNDAWRTRYAAMPEEIARVAERTNSRSEFYNLGLGIALLLDRVRPDWKRHYFDREKWVDELLECGGLPPLSSS